MTATPRRVQLAPGYILHHHPYRDTSRILEVLTRDAGRMSIFARVTVGETKVPLAVARTGLQRFRDFDVVFERIGDTYEVRMLELGRSDATHVEVLEGLAPDAHYVVANSYLIKADIEKSGASHDH